MKKRQLLISDLDDTLLGDDEALRRFATYAAARRDRLELVYATGRFYDTVVDDVSRSSLPAPRAVIGGVGSEMRDFASGEFFDSWRERMSAHWSARRVREILGGEADLEDQPEWAQSEFKVSYFLEDAPRARLAELRSRLEEGGVRVRVVYSSGRDLDVLPEGVDKGSAARHMAGILGFDDQSVVVAGNSANDAALFEHGFCGVVVGNAHEELKALGNSPHVYLASKERADAVIEGLDHWAGRSS